MKGPRWWFAIFMTCTLAGYGLGVLICAQLPPDELGAGAAIGCGSAFTGMIIGWIIATRTSGNPMNID